MTAVVTAGDVGWFALMAVVVVGIGVLAFVAWVLVALPVDALEHPDRHFIDARGEPPSHVRSVSRRPYDWQIDGDGRGLVFHNIRVTKGGEGLRIR